MTSSYIYFTLSTLLISLDIDLRVIYKIKFELPL